MKIKPTSEDCRIIRDCAERSAGYGRVEICPSTKISLVTSAIHFNIAMISDDPDHADTDLFDNAYAWKDFTRGVELTPDGRGIFDFYVYGPLNYWKELQTNVTAYYEGGKLIRVEGTGARKPLWSLT